MNIYHMFSNPIDPVFSNSFIDAELHNYSLYILFAMLKNLAIISLVMLSLYLIYKIGKLCLDEYMEHKSILLAQNQKLDKIIKHLNINSSSECDSVVENTDETCNSEDTKVIDNISQPNPEAIELEVAVESDVDNKEKEQ